MSTFSIFDVAGSALAAQSVRLNTVATNLANAESVTGDPNTVFRAKEPVFSATPMGDDPNLPGVRVTEITESTAQPI
jgi:flagellar basal-body rod protein FlgC